MTTQEAIDLVLSNPRIAETRKVYLANLAQYESEKDSLWNDIKTAQSSLDSAWTDWNKGNQSDDQKKTIERLTEEIGKLYSALDGLRKKWSIPNIGHMGVSSAGPEFFVSPKGEKIYYSDYNANPSKYDLSGGNPDGIPTEASLNTLNQIQNASRDQSQIKNPLTPSATPQVQMPPTVTPQTNKSPAVNTNNLANAYQQKNSSSVASPQITLPTNFQQNANTGPSIYAPTNGNHGIKIPDALKTPNFNKGYGINTNWSDLFSVAHNRYTR